MTQRSIGQTLHDIATIVLLGVFVSIPILGQILGLRNDAESIELRPANPPPALPRTRQEIEAFPGATEAYLEDHFGFRSHLVTLNSLVRSWIGASGSSKVMLGKNGWLFSDGIKAREVYRGAAPYPEEELLGLIRLMESRQEWLAQQGISFLLVLVPEKETAYPEFLPEYMNQVGPTRLDLLTARLEATSNLEFLDLRPVIEEAKKTRPLYLKTDTHWNHLGSFHAYQAIMGWMKRRFPELQPLVLEDFRIVQRDTPGGDLSRMLGLQEMYREDRTELIPRFDSRVIEKRMINAVGRPFAVSTSPFTVSTSTLVSMPSLVVYGDSFFLAKQTGMPRYLRETFHQVHTVKRGPNLFEEHFIELARPDVVVYEMIERSLWGRRQRQEQTGPGPAPQGER